MKPGLTPSEERAEALATAYAQGFNDARSGCADLLAALVQARREYGAYGSLSGETLTQVDSAIAKAEGR